MELYKHQAETVEFMEQAGGRVYNGSDAGTGKTLSTLTYIKRHPPEPGEYMVVLAPKTIAQLAWGDDIEKIDLGFPYEVCVGSRQQKIKAINRMREQGGLLVTNHDAVAIIRENYEGLVGFVVDEGTVFKNRNAKRSKNAKALAALPSIRMAVVMSGTPTPQTVMDFWHQIELVKPKFLPPYTRLRAELQTPRSQITASAEHVIVWEDKPDARLWLSQILEPLLIRYSKDQCLDLPEQTKRFMTVPMSRTLRKHYNELKKEAVLVLEDGVADAVNAAVMMKKLLQVVSGFIYGDKGVAHNLSPERYDLILELCMERDSALVACPLKDQIVRLSEMAERKGLRYGAIDGTVKPEERTRLGRAFQDGEIDYLFCNPKAAGHGLTLTRSQTVIWASPVFSSEEFIQFNARIDRISQAQHNEVIMIKAEGTYEEAAYNRLDHKVGNQLDLLELLT